MHALIYRGKWFAVLRAQVFVSFVVFASFVHAQLAAVPQLVHRVTDLTGTLAATTVAQLEQRLAVYDQRKGTQIAVLLIDSTAPEDIEQYGIRVVDKWKLGRTKVDDGVLLLIAVKDRRMRIEVGYGLEGALPDAIAKRIISDTITPLFKSGQFDTGVIAGVEAILHVVDGEALPTPAEAPADNGFAGGRQHGGSFGIALFVAFVLGRLFGSFARKTPARFGAASLSGVIGGGLVWLLTSAIGFGLLAAVAAFIFALISGGGGGGRWINGSGGFGGGGFGGGGFGGGSFGGGGGGFSGGGGGFGGGGASGSW